jgi:predicted negative regulator of RcsB-dependent stress response|tara:strand:- start:1915 stop:2559 length:645 start_codon:yes stop_codon:yes gene_type:complete
MNEDISIINTNTRNEKIKNFFINNKKILLIFFSSILIFIIGFFAYFELKNSKIKKISDNYNAIIIDYSNKSKKETLNKLIGIINKKDPTYSTLSLYFIIDNELTIDQSRINNLFDILINKTSLDKEIKNLVIFKKALYNAEQIKEEDILDMLKPLIYEKSIWSSHALYLVAEYFYSKDEKQKAKEFFNKILDLENANQDIVIEAQKRLNRDLSD